jgi:nucleotide-binding universal stress UspA family protein
MPETILVALDGSIDALNAATIALHIAYTEQLHLKCIYIVDESLCLNPYVDAGDELGRSDMPDSRDELIRWFEAKGELILSSFRQTCDQAGVDVETEVLFGGVTEIILDRATNASLLSMGRRGNTHSQSLEQLGEHFIHIAHHTPTPLLVGGNESRIIKRLFLMNERSAGIDVAVQWARRLNKDLSASTVVCSIGRDGQEDNTVGIKSELDSLGLGDFSLTNACLEDPPDLIEKAQGSQSGMIIMNGHHHLSIIEMFIGSPVDQILRLSQLPALLV